jgi:hypothetical protein
VPRESDSWTRNIIAGTDTPCAIHARRRAKSNLPCW